MTQRITQQKPANYRDRFVTHIGDGVFLDEEKTQESRSANTHTGIMIAFFLDPATASAIALPKGEPANQLHLTLAYLGEAEDFTGDMDKLKNAVASFARNAKSLRGSISGVGRFTPSDSSDGKVPLYANVDVPELAEFRTDLVRHLEADGFLIDRTHGFTPHVTLKYLPVGDSVIEVPALPLIFNTICLAIGDKHYYYRLDMSEEEQSRSEAKVKHPDSFGDWQKTDKDIQGKLVELQKQGIQRIRWIGHPGCDHCIINHHEIRTLGEPFPNGCYIPPGHDHCECTLEVLAGSERVIHEHLLGQHDQMTHGHGGGSGQTTTQRLTALEKSMSQKYPHCTFDFAGADPEVMQRTCDQIDKLFTAYPDVAKTVPYIGTGENAPDWMKINPEDTAVARVTGGGDLHEASSPIFLNKTYYGNPETFQKMKELCVTREWIPPGCDNIESTFTHEFGHVVNFYLERNGRNKSTFGFMDMKEDGEIAKATREFLTAQSNRGKKVSGYAREGGPREHFAEAFASLHHTPVSQQGTYTKRLGRFLDTMLPNGSSSHWKPAQVMTSFLHTPQWDNWTGLFKAVYS